MSTWELKPMSFVGIVAGASHHMGVLYWPRQEGQDRRSEIEVEAVLTEEAAEALSTDDFTYQAGIASERFLSREAMVEAAKAMFRRLAEPGDVLAHYWLEYEIDRKPVSG